MTATKIQRAAYFKLEDSTHKNKYFKDSLLMLPNEVQVTYTVMVTWLRQHDGSSASLPGFGVGRRQEDRRLQKSKRLLKNINALHIHDQRYPGEIVPSDEARQSNSNTYTLLGWQLASIRVNSTDIQTLICARACLLQRRMEMTPTEGLGNTAEVNRGHCCYDFISLILHCISVHMNLLPLGVWPFTLHMGTQPCTLFFSCRKHSKTFALYPWGAQ